MLRGGRKKYLALEVLTRSADCSAVSELFADFSLPPKWARLWLSFELLGGPNRPKLGPGESKLDSPVFDFFASKMGQN